MKAIPVMLLFSPFKKRFTLIFYKLCISLLVVLPPEIGISQVSDSSKMNNHELTIYVIRSVGPIDWESPSSCYKSYIKAYLNHIFRKKMTLTGHLFIKFSTPLLNETLYAGMCTPSRKERRNLVLKEKIGLAVLGASMKAKLENRKDLIQRINYYSRKNEMAFITYHLNEQAAHRLIDFYQGFTSKSRTNNIPSDYYGGALWPRYIGEGAGCSAFGIAMLDVAGLLDEESKSWMRTVNIPMSLIGGKFNNNHRITGRNIKKTTVWNDGTGLENVDFVPFSIYDPSLIYYWIIQQRKLSGESGILGYFPANEAIIPGLSADRRQVKINPEEPIFVCRPDSNLFIKDYYRKLEPVIKKN